MDPVVIVFPAAFYEHRIIMKHEIDKTKMQRTPKIEHYNNIRLLL